MNEKLLNIWTTIKYDIKLNKKIDYSKLLRQLEIFDNFIKLKGRAYVEACTRFGKTMIAIIAIKRMNLKDINKKTIVVIPTTNLFNDWTKENGHINTFNLKNIEIYIVNTYVLSDRQWKCSLLILDEIHRYCNEDSEYFSTTLNRTDYKYVLGLSATLDISKRDFLKKYGLQLAGKVTLQEAERKGWIAKHYIYNLGLELTSNKDKEDYKQLEEIHDNNFAKFNHDWDLVSACRIGNNKYHYNKSERLKMTGLEWRKWLANRNGWNESLSKDHEWSPKSLSHYAQLWGNAMHKRQTFLHNHKLKLEATVDITKYLKRPTLIFSESTSFADNVALLLEEKSASYHSKILTKIYLDKRFNRIIANGIKIDNTTKFKMVKSGDILTYKQVKIKFPNAKKLAGKNLKAKIIEDFNNGNIDYLVTVKSIDEGFDSDRAEVGIIASGKSQQLQDTQRRGRSLNYIEGKTAIIINVYIKSSQDEKWLNKRQLNIPKGKLKWIININQIER